MNPYMTTAQETASIGSLQVDVVSSENNYPIGDAEVSISYTGDPGSILEKVTTDSSGQSETVSLSAPPVDLSLSPGLAQPYSEYSLFITAQGFEPVAISGTQILADTDAIQPVRMTPVKDQTTPDTPITIPDHTLYGDYPPKIAEAEVKPVAETGEIVLSRVVVPQTIIVHDGVPTDPTASNYYVPYGDYIKNVASSEIYATWPKETIVANVLAIMSFTLNRVYTEWYRNQGYDFTITSSTAFDHKWIYGRNIYESISQVVDEIFNSYLSRPGIKQPILTQYCDGNRVTCPNWMKFSVTITEATCTSIQLTRFPVFRPPSRDITYP
ncbi:MAG: Peptidoglycan-binding domain 1 protein [Lacrimispora sp.]|nr:Peptidoglycan-binding domain 1 protein [Lacrimispora sp.]